MKNLSSLAFAAFIVFMNGALGRHSAPHAIFMTPVVICVTTLLVVLRTKNISSIYLSILTYAFIALNDILIKLYSSGTHDHQGAGWIHLMMFIGLVPSFGGLVAKVVRLKNESKQRRWFAVILFVVLMIIHLEYFKDLGMEVSWYE